MLHAAAYFSFSKFLEESASLNDGQADETKAGSKTEAPLRRHAGQGRSGEERTGEGRKKAESGEGRGRRIPDEGGVRKGVVAPLRQVPKTVREQYEPRRNDKLL